MGNVLLHCMPTRPAVFMLNLRYWRACQCYCYYCNVGLRGAWCYFSPKMGPKQPKIGTWWGQTKSRQIVQPIPHSMVMVLQLGQAWLTPQKNLSCAFFLMCCTVWLGFCLITQVSIYCNIINTKLGVVDMY